LRPTMLADGGAASYLYTQIELMVHLWPAMLATMGLRFEPERPLE
jgi:hypothetical protein